MSLYFSKMIGTLAVILVVAAFIGGSNLFARFEDDNKRWKSALLAGFLGGVFGIYGNISGVNFLDAIITVRDIGPMLAGIIGGPAGGFLAGLICGLHRLFMGGVTAQACVVATCCIGTFCGLLARWKPEQFSKPVFAFVIGALMEGFHLLVVLAMVRPFHTAVTIVTNIAAPFVLTNALGFTLMVAIITYIDRQRTNELERSRLQSELSVATAVQKSVLPPITDQYPGREEIDVAASMEPAKEVGGDFYDVFFVDKDHLALVIADVSGKGIPAALFMMSAKQTVQNCVRDVPDLAEAVAMANNNLCEGNEAEMFVTMWIGILDLNTGEIRYVNAGHNPPALLSYGEVTYLTDRGGFVMGGLAGVPYKVHETRLEKGDVLYLYTDGVTEAEDAAHDLLGEDRLATCLSGCEDAGAGEVVAAVKGAIEDHVKGNAQFDDITMLCVKRR